MEKKPSDNWYCNKCAGNRAPQSPSTPRLFTGLLGDSSKQNTSAFALSPLLRNFFEGIVTGEDGEFEEETNTVKAKKYVLKDLFNVCLVTNL